MLSFQLTEKGGKKLGACEPRGLLFRVLAARQRAWFTIHIRWCESTAPRISHIAPFTALNCQQKKRASAGPEKKANACCTICPAVKGRDNALISGSWFSPLESRGIVPGRGWHYLKPLISYFQNSKLGQSLSPISLCPLPLQTYSFPTARGRTCCLLHLM